MNSAFLVASRRGVAKYTDGFGKKYPDKVVDTFFSFIRCSKVIDLIAKVVTYINYGRIFPDNLMGLIVLVWLCVYEETVADKIEPGSQSHLDEFFFSLTFQSHNYM